MALSRFILPFADVGSGIKPSSGAQLFFYETGTNVFKNTYNCPDGTTANSNPVVADSTGLFPDIFISGTYKVVLEDKNNSQRWEADPVDEFAIIKNNEFTKSFSDLDDAVSDAGLTEGDAVNIKERSVGQDGGGVWDAVLSSSVTETTYDIVQCTGVPTLSLVLRMQEFVSMAQLGANTANSDNTAVWDRMLAIAVSNGIKAIHSKAYKFTQTAHIPGGGHTIDMTGGMILSDPSVVNGITIGDSVIFTGTALDLNVQKLVRNGGLTDYGITYINVAESYILSPEQRNFDYGHACIPTDPNHRVSYNTTVNIKSFGSIFDYYTNPSDGGAYVTENTYLGGRMHATEAAVLNSHIHLADSSTAKDKVEHNRFIGVSIEGWSGGGSSGNRAVWCEHGSHNVFDFCRTEEYNTGWAVAAYQFENASQYNVINDSRFDAVILDDSTGDGQTYNTPSSGSLINKRAGSAEGAALTVKRNINADGSTGAIEVLDTSTGTTGINLLRLESKSNAFTPRTQIIAQMITATGRVFAVDDQGSLLPLSNNKAYLGDSTHKFKEQHTNFGVFADDAAAGVAGLTAGQHYQTATGELRVKL